MKPRMTVLLLMVVGAVVAGCAHRRAGSLLGEFAPPLKVGRITFDGNRALPARELQSIMRTEQGKPYDDFLLQQDRKALILLYRRRGFLEAKIVKTDQKVDAEKSQMDIFFQFSEGPQVLTQDIQFTGSTVFPTSELERQISLHPGEPMDELSIDFSRIQITSLYAHHGYLYTQVSDTTVRFPGSNQAKLILDIREGKQVRLGNITITFLDQTRIRKRTVERELTIHPGDVLDMDKVRESRQKVYATGLFREANFRLEGLESQRDTVDLVLELRMDKTRSLGLGASWQPPSGLQGTMEWGNINLLGNAQALRLSEALTYSFRSTEIHRKGLESLLDLEYLEPYFLSTTLKARGHFFLKRELVENQVYNRSGGDARIGRYLGRTLQTFVGYKYEYVLEGGDVTSSLLYSISQDTRDNVFNPSRGVLQGLTTEHAGGFLGGVNDFDRVRAEFSLYHSPGWRLTTALHLAGGWQGCYGRTRFIPPYERFELRQANAIRGYEEIALSDTVHTQEILGQVGYEIRFPLFDVWFPPYGSMQGAIFLDGGNIQSDSRFFNLSTTRFGTGLGLRYLTAIGPVRFDYGLKAEQKTRLNGGRWYISLGHAF